MTFGGGFLGAIAQAQQQRTLAQYNRYLEVQNFYGDAFAGIRHDGRVILWRKTTIPSVRRASE